MFYTGNLGLLGVLADGYSDVLMHCTIVVYLVRLNFVCIHDI